ncbi:MAG: isochorismatase family cysteine hydrolase [Pseudomonadota bacterium]
MMHTALIVVDMVKDNLELSTHDHLARRCLAIVDQVNALAEGARQKGWPVVYATDSFLPGDAIFRGRMSEHSLRGTAGAEVSSLLERQPQDVWLPKRRLSSFFKTDLDQTLRLWRVERVAVCGLMTPYCVLMTALDAVSLDFQAVIVEDACASFSDAQQRGCLDIYRKSPLRPVLSVMSTQELLA